MRRVGSVRVVLGTLLVGLVLLGALVVSPTATVAAFDGIVTDPTTFALLVIGLYVVRPLFAWPTTPLAVVVGYGYGLTQGVPIALLGVAFTVLPTFGVARWLLERDATAQSAELSDESGSTVEATAITGRFDTFLERSHDVVTGYYENAGPVRGVIASRLAPIPSDIATCAAAASGVSSRQLVAGTVIGELPWTIAAVALGASAASLTGAMAQGTSGEYGLVVALFCTATAGMLLGPTLYRALRHRGEAVK
ncbi:VTT domain-containing protein [Halobacteria archaeon AArc-curdl1]|uniref:VTT domain-containing protein n=1 Tax=Natronosalvus hydrolyticus TaxID=2979988 RepID=A0AAP2Z765_9EURY|nr:VTT domain-containing protein [Halobacteria archaeon AArc-curdl1]